MHTYSPAVAAATYKCTAPEYPQTKGWPHESDLHIILQSKLKSHQLQLSRLPICISNLYLCPSASVPPCSQGHPQALSRRSHIQYFTVSNTRFQTNLYPLPYMQGACIATKSFGTCAILKKKDGNGPVHDEEAGSWTESKRMSPS